MVAASVGWLTYAWVAVTVVFEALTLARVFVLGDAVSDAQPMYSMLPDKARPDAAHLTFTLVLLVAARVGALLYPSSKGAWGVLALVHVTEAAFFAALIGPAILAKPPSFDVASARTQGVVIFTAVMANAVLFTRAWSLLPNEHTPRTKAA